MATLNLKQGSAFLQTRSKSLDSFYLILVAAISAQMLGEMALGFEYGTPIRSMLFMEWGLSDLSATFIDRSLLSLSGLALCSLWPLPLSKNLRSWSALFIAFQQVMKALAILATKPDGQFLLAPLAHGIRILLPLAIASYQILSIKQIKKILGVGVCLTFIGHGLEALAFRPSFIDFIIYFSPSFNFGIQWESFAKSLLVLIGLIDIGVAGIFFANQSKKALFYMGAWGLVTALIRIPYYGELGIWEFLLRTSHWTIPFYLLYSQGSEQ